MQLSILSIYKGRNIYAPSAAIHAQVKFDTISQADVVNKSDAFTSKIKEFFPDIKPRKHLSNIIEQVLVQLLSLANEGNIYHRIIDIDEEDSFEIIYGYRERETGLAAMQLTLAIISNLLPDNIQSKRTANSNFDAKKMIEQFEYNSYRRGLDQTVRGVISAAEKNDVPWLRLSPYSNIVQLGQGCFQKRIFESITSQSQHCGYLISNDKVVTNHVLDSLDIPVAPHIPVQIEADALTAANRISYPLVVKPSNAQKGLGITVGVLNDQEISAAFKKANQFSQTVLIEKFIAGDDHRILIVGDNMIAAAKLIPAHVTGDGKHTIKQLIEIINEHPDRGVGYQKMLVTIEIDNEVIKLIKRKGYGLQTVLAKDEIIEIKGTANISTGGSAIDVTNIVHPDNILLAKRAAKAVSLDVAGIDFITPDISKSYKDTPSIICEVNACPGIRPHALWNTDLDVFTPVFEQTLITGAKRIPIVAITGCYGKTTTSEILSHILSKSGHHVGLANSNGVYLNNHQIKESKSTDWKSAQLLLRDPTVDSAVIETSYQGILRLGLGYDRSNVCAVLNITDEKLENLKLSSINEIIDVNQVVVDAAHDLIVLNADDENCVKMAENYLRTRICYVTQNGDNKIVKKHIKDGHMAVVVNHNTKNCPIHVITKKKDLKVINSNDIDPSLNCKDPLNIANASFAIALAIGLDTSIDSIQQSLSTP